MTDTVREPAPSEPATPVAGERPPCQAADADEPMGGDPPCWAHLFEDDEAAEDR